MSLAKTILSTFPEVPLLIWEVATAYLVGGATAYSEVATAYLVNIENKASQSS